MGQGGSSRDLPRDRVLRQPKGDMKLTSRFSNSSLKVIDLFVVSTSIYPACFKNLMIQNINTIR
jgi:hypothetical protein